MLRIAETTNGHVCGNHQNKTIRLMVSSVAYPEGCEECTHKAFAEALELALEAGAKCPQCGGPRLYPGMKCYGDQNAFHNS